MWWHRVRVGARVRGRVRVVRRGGRTAPFPFSACRFRRRYGAAGAHRRRDAAGDSLRSAGSSTWNGTVFRSRSGCGSPTGAPFATTCWTYGPIAIRPGLSCFVRSSSSWIRPTLGWSWSRCGRQNCSTAIPPLASGFRSYVRLHRLQSDDLIGSNESHRRRGNFRFGFPGRCRLAVFGRDGSVGLSAPARRDGSAVATARAFDRF